MTAAARLRALTTPWVVVAVALVAGCGSGGIDDPLPVEVLRWEPSGVRYVALAVRIHNDRDVPVTPVCHVSTRTIDGRVEATESFEVREPIPPGGDNTYRVLTRLEATGVADVEVECEDGPG